MDIQIHPRLSSSRHSEISIDRHSDGVCLASLEARVQEGYQNLPSKIQRNREKLWEIYLCAIALDGPFPQGQDVSTTDTISLDQVNAVESGEAVPPVTANLEPVIWIDEERTDLVLPESNGNIGLRKRVLSAVLSAFSQILNQASRSSKFAGTNLLLGLIPVAGPVVCSVLYYVQVYRKIGSLEIGRPALTVLSNKALQHMVKQFLIAFFLPVVGAVYNRIVQWNRISYEQAEVLVLEHRSANLEFITFRNEVFNWTAEQRAQGVTTLESSPPQCLTVVEVVNVHDPRQRDAAAALELPDCAEMPFGSYAGMVFPLGVQAWVESQVRLLPPPEVSEIICPVASGAISQSLFPAAVSIVPHDFDPTMLGSKTMEVTDRPQPSSAIIHCRRPVVFDVPTEPVFVPAEGSGSSSESNLSPVYSGRPTMQVIAEESCQLQETGASSSCYGQVHGNDTPVEDVESPRPREHESHESSDDERSLPRRDKGKGRAVDTPSSPLSHEEDFMFADLSAAGPSSLGARLIANNSGLRPIAPVTIAEYDDPRTYSYPLGPLFTPAEAEMENQQKDLSTAASLGHAKSPLDRLTSVLSRLSEPTLKAHPISVPMPGSPPLSSLSNRPKTRQEEAKLEGGRRYAINEILDRRGLRAANPSSSEGFIRFDSFSPMGNEAGTSSLDALHPRLQAQSQDQGVLGDTNGILSCHYESGVPVSGPHICAAPLCSSMSCDSTNSPFFQESQPTGLPHPPPGRKYMYVKLTNSYVNMSAPRRKDVVSAEAAQTQPCRFLQDEAQSLQKYRNLPLDYRGLDSDKDDREIGQEEYRQYVASLPHIDDTPEGTAASSSNRTLDDVSSQWDFNSDDQVIADRNARRFQRPTTPPPSNVFRRTTRSIGKIWKSTLHVLKIKKKPTGGDGRQQEEETGEPLSTTTTLVCWEASNDFADRVAMEVAVAPLCAEEPQVSLSSQTRLPSTAISPSALPAPVVPLEESRTSSSSQSRFSLPELPPLVLPSPFVPLEERRPELRQGRDAVHLPAPLELLPPYSETDPATPAVPTYLYPARPVRWSRPATVQRGRRLHVQAPVDPVAAHIQNRRTSTTASAQRASLLLGPPARGPSEFREEARLRYEVSGHQVNSTTMISNRSAIVRRPALRIASTSSSSNTVTTRRPLIDLILTRGSSNVMNQARPSQSHYSSATRSNATSVRRPLIDLIPDRGSSNIASQTCHPSSAQFGSGRVSRWAAATGQRPLIDLIPTRASSNSANGAYCHTAEQFSSGRASRPSAALTHRPLIDLIPPRGSFNIANEVRPTADRCSSGNPVWSNVARAQHPSVGPAHTQPSSNAVKVTLPAFDLFGSSSAVASSEATAGRPSVGPPQLSHRITNDTRFASNRFNLGSTTSSNKLTPTVSTGGNLTEYSNQPGTHVNLEDSQSRNHLLSAYSFATAGRLHYSSSHVSASSDQGESEPEVGRDQDSEDDDGNSSQNIHEGASDGDGDDDGKDDGDDKSLKADVNADTEDEDEEGDDADDDENSNSASDGPRILRVMNPDPNPEADSQIPSQNNSEVIARAWQAGHLRSPGPTLLLCSSFTPNEDDESPYFQRTCRRRRDLTPLPDQTVLNSFESWAAQAKEDEILQRLVRSRYLSFSSCPMPPSVYPSQEDAAQKFGSRRLACHSQQRNLSSLPLMANSRSEIASLIVADRTGYQTERSLHHTVPSNPVSTAMAPTMMPPSSVTSRPFRDSFIPPVELAPTHSGDNVTKVDHRNSQKLQLRKAQEELRASFGLTYYHSSDNQGPVAEPSSVPESCFPSNHEQARHSTWLETRKLEAERVHASPIANSDAHQWLLETFSASSAVPKSTGPVRSDGCPWSTNTTMALQAASQMYPIHPLDQDGNPCGGELTEEPRRLANRQWKLQAAQALIFMAKDDEDISQGGSAATGEQSSISLVSSAPGQAQLEPIGDLAIAFGSLEVDSPLVKVAPPTTPPIDSRTSSPPESGPYTVSPAEALASMPLEPQMNTEHLTFELNNVVMAQAERAYYKRTGSENGALTDRVVRAFSFASAYQEPIGSKHGLPEILTQRVNHAQEPRR